MCLLERIQHYLLVLSLLFGALVLTHGHAFAQDMTIQQAYDAIPHRRTIYDYDNAQMLIEEKQFLLD